MNTEKEVKHSPLNWNNKGLEIFAPSTTGVLVAHCMTAADAAFIVRAVNSHDELEKIVDLYMGGKAHEATMRGFAYFKQAEGK